MTITYKDFMAQLEKGFSFEFMYMGKIHKVTQIDRKAFTLVWNSEDNYSTRENKQIVSRKVVREMFKGMSEITYSY